MVVQVLHPFGRIDPTESVELVLETLKLKVCIFLLFIYCLCMWCVRTRVQQGELAYVCEDQRLTLSTSSIALCII